ncbi:MAG: helix-turn-helix transcriptional regulator [Alphaproteobacteria bacterium]|nr:MAG: helix-turn-helix transcriptional regulator [Alphaproteobacteria bacterium]
MDIDNYNNLRLIRNVRRISAKTLANRSGYSQAYISRIECGRRRLNTQVLYKLSLALDCPVSALVDRDISRALADVKGTAPTHGQQLIPDYTNSVVRVVSR